MAEHIYPLTGRFLQGRLRHAMEERERRLLEDLIERTEVIQGETAILRRGDFCEYSTLLIEGMAIRAICDDEGRRHIVGVQVPGDFVDLHGFALKRLDHDLCVIGRARVGYVPHERLRAVMADEPHLARLFWFSTLLDAAIHREWIMKSTQLRAIGRMAHFFAELWYRLRMVDLGQESSFQTPLTQIHLASICGISTIHVSRTLRDLRDGGVVDFQRGQITISDGDKLKSIARFDPAYLYSEGGLAVENALDIDSPERLSDL